MNANERRKHVADLRRYKVQNLWLKEMTNDEISLESGISIKIIRYDLSYLKLKSNTIQRRDIYISEEFKQLVLGSILGDGHLKGDLSKNHSIRLQIAHSPKQKIYLLSKYKIIQPIISSTITNNTIINLRYKKGFIEEFRLTTKSCKFLTEMKSSFYQNGKKGICKKLIYELNDLGLAIWYFDDGYLTTHGYRISTNFFSLEELKVLQNMLLKNFDIKSNIHKGNILYIPSLYKDRFTELIKPYATDDVKYKLH